MLYVGEDNSCRDENDSANCFELEGLNMLWKSLAVKLSTGHFSAQAFENIGSKMSRPRDT